VSHEFDEYAYTRACIGYATGTPRSCTRVSYLQVFVFVSRFRRAFAIRGYLWSGYLFFPFFFFFLFVYRPIKTVFLFYVYPYAYTTRVMRMLLRVTLLDSLQIFKIDFYLKRFGGVRTFPRFSTPRRTLVESRSLTRKHAVRQRTYKLHPHKRIFQIAFFHSKPAPSVTYVHLHMYIHRVS